MKCRYCGYEIPEGMLYCGKCGKEVRIVPDYNPLEDMLTAQIKGAISGEESYEDYIDYDSIRNTDPRRSGSAAGQSTGRSAAGGVSRSTSRSMGGGLSRSTGRDMGGVSRSTSRDMGGVSRSTSRDMGGLSRSTSRDMGGLSRSTSRDIGVGTGRNTSRDVGVGVSRNTGSSRRGTGPQRGYATGNLSEREKKRRQSERKKAKRRQRMGCCFLLFLLAAAVIGSAFTLYMNSYKGFVARGDEARKAGEYNRAIDFYEKAVKKDESKAEAYIGLSKVYIGKNDLDWAESIFREAVKKQPDNADIYEGYVKFYMDTDQKDEIPLLLSDVDEEVAERLAGYITKGPEFSLDDKEPYEDVQELSLSTEEGYTIYYTDDGEEATTASTKYTEPLLIGEGESVITAIAVDTKGVPSLPVKKTYKVELPVVDAPAVSPSTGQYNSAMQIEIKIPEGYAAYYTTNGEDPTTASALYTGPIEMPEGETLFKAVLVNGKGRMSGVTTRNYVLEPEQTD